MCRKCIQPGYTRPKEDSCPRRDEGRLYKFASYYLNGVNLKFTGYLFLELST
jgi:hypothetical protein